MNLKSIFKKFFKVKWEDKFSTLKFKVFKPQEYVKYQIAYMKGNKCLGSDPIKIEHLVYEHPILLSKRQNKKLPCYDYLGIMGEEISNDGYTDKETVEILESRIAKNPAITCYMKCIKDSEHDAELLIEKFNEAKLFNYGYIVKSIEEAILVSEKAIGITELHCVLLHKKEF